MHIEMSSVAAKGKAAEGNAALEDSEHEAAPLEVQENVLPDVYPEDEK